MPNQFSVDSCRKQFERQFHKNIEDYDSIKRAVETLSTTSKNNYYRNLPLYFLFLGEDPDTVIKNRRRHISEEDPEKAEFYEHKTKAYVNKLIQANYAGAGISSVLGRIQGFYANNSRRYSLSVGRLRIPKARKNPKYSPDNTETRQLYTVADCSRDRLIVAIMYQNGPAPIDVSELIVSDLPRETWSYFEKSRSKTGEVWRAVSTPDTTEALKNYLKIRGENNPKERLFKSREGYLDNQAITRIVGDLIVKAGFGEVKGFKPTSLRDAFEDALVDANINHKIKEALMGHTGDIEHQYGSYKKLKENCVAAMKQTYKFISLSDNKLEVFDSKKEFEDLKLRILKMEKIIHQLAKRSKTPELTEEAAKKAMKGKP